MELTTNSYGFNVPKDDYEKLQKEVDKRNEIRLKSLMDFNLILEKVGIEAIALDGEKSIKELFKLNVEGTVHDDRINRLPPAFKNPYDRNFDDMDETECFKLMETKVKEFYNIDVNKMYDNLSIYMKCEFEERLTDYVERSVNPIRFTLLNKVKEMSTCDFIKIYFRWYNNIAGEDVFPPNTVINQWAWYFGIETTNEYDCVTDEDMNLYNDIPKIYINDDDDDKEIRHYFYDLYS